MKYELDSPEMLQSIIQMIVAVADCADNNGGRYNQLACELQTVARTLETIINADLVAESKRLPALPALPVSGDCVLVTMILHTLN